MARIDRHRLATAAYPFTLEIATRFDDLDMQGHVNNAAGAVILQEARVGFNRMAGLPTLMGALRTMVASITIEYAGEMYHPAPVVVSVGILAIGRTSYTLGMVMRQDGTPRVYAQVVMVLADKDGPAPIPDSLRASFEALALDPTT